VEPLLALADQLRELAGIDYLVALNAYVRNAQIEQKVLKRLRQVTGAIRQDGSKRGQHHPFHGGAKSRRRVCQGHRHEASNRRQSAGADSPRARPKRSSSFWKLRSPSRARGSTSMSSHPAHRSSILSAICLLADSDLH
jgi:hypothetical protein